MVKDLLVQELLNSGSDSFSTVIGQRPPSHAFLYERGVTRTNLKNGVGSCSSIIVSEELTDKIRKELKEQFDKEMAGFAGFYEDICGNDFIAKKAFNVCSIIVMFDEYFGEHFLFVM
ncbi:uncharacterized protein LOC126674738 isoform X2 [Mercurialis annua]|uniref:uncharacterized protein LOC126674738 isoform X2 n=1 Tax=Mercurialis annua TaxID=3986 RepID=UPI0024ACD4CD|nr:uncharacterized protein LOC126674738 isoform X2 [Mercurialis annua]